MKGVFVWDADHEEFGEKKSHPTNGFFSSFKIFLIKSLIEYKYLIIIKIPTFRVGISKLLFVLFFTLCQVDEFINGCNTKTCNCDKFK